MTTAVTIVEAPTERQFLYALTVDQYHRMIDLGILPEGEPFELVAGQVVRKERHGRGEDPMTVGNAHAVAVTGLSELNSKLRRMECHMRPQLPITIPPHDEPEPDGAIVRGRKEDYLKGHPKPSDTFCVIEVADATLQYDRNTKLATYASAGIGQYVIINLVDKTVEVYERPIKSKARYGHSETLVAGETMTLRTARSAGLKVPVRRLLPWG